MAHACAVDADREVAADLMVAGLVGGGAEERGDVGESDRMDGRAEQMVVEGGQIVSAAEDDVGGVFGLGDAPAVGAGRSQVGNVARDSSIHAGVNLGHG